MPFLQEHSGYFLLFVKVTPNASRSKIKDVCVDDKNQEYLSISISAIPDDDKANKALVTFLSKKLKISKSSIIILRGHKARMKVLKIWGENIAVDSLNV